MGKGDRRTAKGKRTRKSYGNSRPKKVKKNIAPAPAAAEETTPAAE